MTSRKEDNRYTFVWNGTGHQIVVFESSDLVAWKKAIDAVFDKEDESLSKLELISVERK